MSAMLVLPMMLARLDAPEMAVMQLFATIASLLLVLDFGLSPTLARFYSYGMGGATIEEIVGISGASIKKNRIKNTESIVKVYATMTWLYHRLAIVIVILLSLAGTAALIRPMGEVKDVGQAWVGWGVTLIGCGWTVWGNSSVVALMGGGNIAPMRRWETLFAAMQIISTSAVLYFNGGVLALVLSNQLWAVLNVIRNKLLLRAIQPELTSANHAPAKELMGVVWPSTWRAGIGVLMSQGIIQSSGLIYSQYAAASAVASYLLALRVITLISQVSQVPFYTKVPVLGQMLGSGRKDELVNLARKGMAQSLLIYSIGVVFVLYFVGPLLGLVKSKISFVGPEFWMALSIAFFAERFGAMHMQVYSVGGEIIWHIVNGITGCILIAAFMLLYPILGAIAMPVSMIVGYVGFYSWYTALKSYGFQAVKFYEYESRAMIPSALILLASFLCYVLIVL
jgi:hypothetical protein